MTNPDQTLALFQLNQLRASIDNMDSILIHTLAERFKLTQQVGKAGQSTCASRPRPCGKGP